MLVDSSTKQALEKSRNIITLIWSLLFVLTTGQLSQSSKVAEAGPLPNICCLIGGVLQCNATKSLTEAVGCYEI